MRTSHQFRAPVKALTESRMEERKWARLREAGTRVQRRSSLGKYVVSQGFIYLRLGKFQSDDKAKGTWWNAMEL